MKPLRKGKAILRGGGTILSSFKFHWWEIELECGHVVERRVRWLPPQDGSRAPRGYAAQWQGVPLNRLPNPPQSARCEECPDVAPLSSMG